MSHLDNPNSFEESNVVSLDAQLSNLDESITKMESKLSSLKEEQSAAVEGKGVVFKPLHASEISSIRTQLTTLKYLKKQINSEKSDFTHETRGKLSLELGQMITLTETNDHTTITNQLGLLDMDIRKRMRILDQGGRKSVRDLIESNISFDNYTYNIHTKEMYNIITEAFLNTKNREWVKDFKESKFKKTGLDGTKQEFISQVFMEACSNMNPDMLNRLKSATMIITIDGKQEVFGADSHLTNTFNYDYQQAIAKAQTLHSGKKKIDNLTELSPQEEIIENIPTPKVKPENQNPIIEKEVIVTDIPSKNKVLEIMENSPHIKSVIELLIRQELTGKEIGRKEEDGGKIHFTADYINTNMELFINEFIYLAQLFGETESNLNPQGRNGYNREGINTLKGGLRRSTAKGMYQYLTGNGGWRKNNEGKTYWGTSSHETANNNVYTFAKNVKDAELKALLARIAPNYITKPKSGLDARNLSIEEQTIMFLIDMFKNPRSVKNANGDRVYVRDYLGLAATGNNWSQDMIYAIFHHTSPDDKGVRDNMKRGRDVVDGLTSS